MLRGPQLLRRLLRPPPLPPRHHRGWCSGGSTPSGDPAPNGRGDLLSLRPSELVDFLRCRGIQRCYAVCDDGGTVRVSHPELQDLADWLNSGSEQQFRSHEAILMQLGLRTGCLMTAFLWRTDRGQAVRSYIHTPPGFRGSLSITTVFQKFALFCAGSTRNL
ncbi:hypothetical protein MTO96_004435 [Rhipicephalus appendiculatus]